MKVNIFDKSKNKVGEIELPMQFNEEIRPDIIRRAVLSIQGNKRQPYGAAPEAGKRPSVRLSKRRRDYRGVYGYGISRVPRKIFSRMGRRMNWQAAFAPGTVKGRKAHPPKAGRNWHKKLNKKERRKAIRSAIAATIFRNIVEERGHIIPEDYPFILNVDFESIDKTKDVKSLFEKLGFKEELERADRKKIRAGKGKIRGRKYKIKKSLLVVISKDSNKAAKAAENILGIEVVPVNKLNAEVLAPGGVPGRATLWTKDAIERLNKEKLFVG